MIGSVMMSITSSTSITSMSGVVLMSHISSSAFVPIAIAMSVSLQQRSVLHAEELRQRVLVGLGDETHLHHPTALDRKQHPADRGVLHVLVRADVDLRLRLLHRHLVDV